MQNLTCFWVYRHRCKQLTLIIEHLKDRVGVILQYSSPYFKFTTVFQFPATESRGMLPVHSEAKTTEDHLLNANATVDKCQKANIRNE